MAEEKKQERTVTISASMAILAAAAMSYKSLWTGDDRRWYRCRNCRRECYLIRVGEEPAPTACIDAGRNAKWEVFE